MSVILLKKRVTTAKDSWRRPDTLAVSAAAVVVLTPADENQQDEWEALVHLIRGGKWSCSWCICSCWFVITDWGRAQRRVRRAKKRRGGTAGDALKESGESELGGERAMHYLTGYLG